MGAADRERAASRCRRRLLESLAKSLDAQQDFSDVGLDELPFSRQLDLSADFSVEPNAAEIFQRLHLLENDGSLMLSDAALVMLRCFETAPNARIWLSVISSPFVLTGLLYDCPLRLSIPSTPTMATIRTATRSTLSISSIPTPAENRGA